MKTMRVLLSTYEKNTNIGQEVYFINITNSFEPLGEEPTKIEYSNRNNTSLLINYEKRRNRKNKYGKIIYARRSIIKIF